MTSPRIEPPSRTAVPPIHLQGSDAKALISVINDVGWFGGILTHPQLPATTALYVAGYRYNAEPKMAHSPVPIDRPRGNA